MSIKSIIKKAFIISSLVVSSILLISGGWLYFNQDSLINQFVNEANQHINTPVEVDKISISFVSTFPLITIRLDNIRIQGSLPDKAAKPLLTAKQIDLIVDPMAIIAGNIKINGIIIDDASCHMRIEDDGKTNYQILKQNSSHAEGELGFELTDVKLSKIKYSYWSKRNNVKIELLTTTANTKLILEGGTYYINSNGKYLINNISVKDQDYVTNKTLAGSIDLEYKDEIKTVEIGNSDIIIEGSEFATYGSYSFKDENSINLFLESEQTSIESITKLLPLRLSKHLAKYKSNGNAYFNLSMIGGFRGNKGPELKAQFGLDNAEITYPSKDISIQKVKTEGLFAASNILDLATARLELLNIAGQLEKKDFIGSLEYNNFKNPRLKLFFEGDLDIHSVEKFVETNSFETSSGVLDVSIQFNGALKDLKSKVAADKILANGQIEFKDLNISHNTLKQPIKSLNGALLFNNSDVALSDIKGFYGESDFMLNGFFKNLFAYLLFKDEPLGIEADLISDYINLNQLLSAQDASDSKEYSFRLSPRLRLKFSCEIANLEFRRFNSRNVKGGLIIKDEQLQTDKIIFDAMGGHVSLSGQANTSKSNRIYTSSVIDLQEVNIDSLFYVFENFEQSFIESKHLKGAVDGTIISSMELDSLLKLYPSTLESNITLSLENAQLNGFEPLQQLSKYIEEDELMALRFSNISTDILIKDQTVFIPEIQINSNATNLSISGTHTFDQRINYKIATPLKVSRKIDKDEAFGAIEEVGGQSMLFLKIEGTTDNYTVSYDKEEVKKKVISDLKKEVQELKQAFKNKGLDKNKKVELEEDDYFDW